MIKTHFYDRICVFSLDRRRWLVLRESTRVVQVTYFLLSDSTAFQVIYQTTWC